MSQYRQRKKWSRGNHTYIGKQTKRTINEHVQLGNETKRVHTTTNANITQFFSTKEPAHWKVRNRI